ncbi:MAG: hypothetical protein II529_06525 [Erysipelotrichaceae bacterium]|nr:hypothetical protein [Erysipelotrichaceae bacterium]
MKAKIEGLTAQGNGVYEDRKGRAYVADRKNRTLYAVNKDAQKKLSLYQQRHLIPMILLVTFGFYVNWYVGIGLALGSIVVLEYLYNQIFLKSLVKYEDVDIPAEPTLTDKLADSSRKKIIAILVMSSLLPILLIINLIAAIKLSGGLLNDTNNLILLIVSVALIVYASRYIYASVMALKRQ